MAVARGGTQTGLAARGHSRILGQDSGEAGGLGWRISPVRRQRWGQRKKEKNKTKKTSSKTGGEGAVGGHRTATCVVFPRGFTVKKKKNLRTTRALHSATRALLMRTLGEGGSNRLAEPGCNL